MAKKKDDTADDKPMEYGSMAGEYKCPNCGEQVYHGSKAGVEVACMHCGERSTVPE